MREIYNTVSNPPYSKHMCM